MRKPTIVFMISVLFLIALVLFLGTKSCSANELIVRTISAEGTIKDTTITHQVGITAEQAIKIACPEAVFRQFSYGKLLKSIPTLENKEHNRFWYILVGNQPVEKLGPSHFMKISCDKYILQLGDNIAISYQGEATTTISKLKDFNDGNLVNLTGIVTANFGNSAYLEAKNRVSAIKLDMFSDFSKGIILSIGGIIGKKNDLRQITNIEVKKWTNDQTLRPFYLQNASIGGSDKPNQLGAFGAKGPNNVGLLVTTTGKVTGVGTGYIIIKDGSLPDGLKVITNTPIGLDHYIQATGISSIERIFGVTKPVLITRSSRDVTIY